MEEVTAVATVVAMVVVAVAAAVDRPATHAEAMGTCLETALKARNATTV